MKKVNRPACGECSFFLYEDADGFGFCCLRDKDGYCTERCDLDHTKMGAKAVAKGLHEFQKWRRGGEGKMPLPYVIGKLIDAAIYHLRHDVI